MIWPFARPNRELTAQQRALLEAFSHEPEPDLSRDIDALRWVVVDVETTGLDARTDRVLSIGAVAIEGGLIRLGESFHVTLKQPRPSSSDNILIHGIDGATQVSATEPVDAMLAWLAFARKSPRVAFHAPFDRAVLERAERSLLGTVPRSRWLDAADLAPLCLERGEGLVGLDEWLRALEIGNAQRHDALGDALATAQLFQVVLAAARAAGHRRCRDLTSLARARRWLAGR